MPLKKRTKELVNRVLRNHTADLLSQIRVNDIQASIELGAIDVGFVPRTSYSLSPVVILHLLNELIINERKQIIEFGSGISTIYLAKTIKERGLDTTICSIDESAAWQAIVASELKRLGCLDNIELIHAPIAESGDGLWFDEEELSNRTTDRKLSFDLVIIDGPSTKSDARVRRRARSFLLDNNLLAEEHTIFIDDTSRAAERELAHEWQSEIKHSKLLDYVTYCVVSCGRTFITRPQFTGHAYKVGQYFGIKDGNRQ